MLISQHAVHLQAVRDLYHRCVTREGFPGSPLQELGQGYPGTHAILDRLGLIKHAEEAIEDPQKVLADIIDYLQSLDADAAPECLDGAESTDTSDTTVSGEVSPEPSTPREEVLDLSMQSVEHAWAGSEGCYAYDSYEPPLQQQTNIAPQASVDDAGTFRGHCDFAPAEAAVPVLWNTFPAQFRYMPADAACQRVGLLPAEMQWAAMMASNPLSAGMPETSRGDAADAGLYIADQTYFPEFYGYAHLYGAGA
jgi:hypothetical protein